MRAMLAALLLLLAAAADAAVVRLKDGSTVRGTVVGATAREIQIYTDSGTRKISTDRIDRIDYSEGAGGPAQAAPAAPPEAAAPPPAPRPTVSRPSRPVWEEDRRHLLDLDIGVAIPLSDLSFGSAGGSGSNGDVGARLGVEYLYFPSERLGLGAAFDYLGRGGTDDRDLVGSASSDVHGTSVLLLGVARVMLRTEGQVRPYLQGGLGAHHTSTIVDVTPLPGFAWSDTLTDETRRLVDGASWGPATRLAFGLDFAGFGPSAFGVELSWDALMNGRYAATRQGVDTQGLSSVGGTLHVLTVAARWGWRFE